MRLFLTFDLAEVRPPHVRFLSGLADEHASSRSQGSLGISRRCLFFSCELHGRAQILHALLRFFGEITRKSEALAPLVRGPYKIVFKLIVFNSVVENRDVYHDFVFKTRIQAYAQFDVLISVSDFHRFSNSHWLTSCRQEKVEQRAPRHS